VPVVGPFIAIGTLGATSGGGVVLAIDGLAQSGGLAMIIVGAIGKTVLVRNDIGRSGNPLELQLGGSKRLELMPMFGMGATHAGHGAGLKLSF
jgi:hypothetical protein